MIASKLFFDRSSCPSDIQEHMPTLYQAARGLILELGVGEGRSTAAFLAGLEARGGGFLVSVDNRDVGIVAMGYERWKFIQADSLNLADILPVALRWACDACGLMPASPPERPISVLFIDTDHTYDRTLAELRLWGPLVKRGGTILLHDTRSHEGVMPAMLEYCRETGLNCREQPNNNGLGHIYIHR
jgi:cephalosporin hydroxylase